jgi:hypothetical protein
MDQDRWAYEIEFDNFKEFTGGWFESVAGAGSLEMAEMIAAVLSKSAHCANVVLTDVASGEVWIVEKGCFELQRRAA